MTLTVNGQAVEVAAPVTVAELVAARTDQRRIAVARNGEVVPRSAWAATALTEGDEVEILAAVAGG
ncbi:thiamine biosynthesis protein ThiS [Asanoa ishikariensis]|uniref:Sulfur carrier protein ThiS n=1 Tax=Asanoa ishikariensis TaxID=137265 RepID=A0A1H3UJW7_9ACTN|nr:sulfur carrier protein ThiS [Asanoa ishikariensis]GIF63456.1 thiamine biosynthesis protein ThiS [Asanoa ishikariensis]SDZ62115.1 sulfur carrier protein ThiS [Asanoa ishikariensis]